jgi:Bacterial SH3 domain
MFILVMAVLAAGAWAIIRDMGADDAQAGGLARALGLRQTDRIREGFVRDAIQPKPTGEAPLAQAATPHDSTTGGPVGETVDPSLAPAGDPPSVGEGARITGTGGAGVVLRTLPRQEAQVPRGLLENTRVTVLDRAGDAWVLVRAENGLEGWVPAEYVSRKS